MAVSSVCLIGLHITPRYTWDILRTPSRSLRPLCLPQGHVQPLALILCSFDNLHLLSFFSSIFFHLLIFLSSSSSACHRLPPRPHPRLHPPPSPPPFKSRSLHPHKCTPSTKAHTPRDIKASIPGPDLLADSFTATLSSSYLSQHFQPHNKSLA